MRKCITKILLMVILVGLLAGCSQKQTMENAKEFYISYLEEKMSDSQKATSYCFYQDNGNSNMSATEIRELHSQAPLLDSYEIVE